MLTTRCSRVAAVALTVLVVACGDPTRPRATFANTPFTFTLYALTGAPPVVPTAFSLLSGPVRATGTFAFDIAVDLDSAGRPVVYPVRLLAGSLAGGGKRVGLQPLTGRYESIREVPKAGYDTLRAQTLSPGRVLAVETLDFNACLSSIFAQTLHAKLVVDSVDLAARRLFMRAVVDPNCGYLQVHPDTIPDN